MQMKTIKNTKYAQECTKFSGKQGERMPIVITRQERTAAWPQRQEKGVPKVRCSPKVGQIIKSI